LDKSEKEALVAELQGEFEKAQGAILADYRGLTVGEIMELRRKLREETIRFRVVKNTLTKIVARNLGLEELERLLEGPTAVAFGDSDTSVVAKLLLDYAKQNAKLKIKGGLLGTRIIDAEEVKNLASLPPREVILGQVLGGMQGPLSGFVGVLSSLLRQFAYAVLALQKKREEQAA